MAWPYHCFQGGAGGSRTHLKLLCRQPPCRLAPAPRCQCPRQESNLGHRREAVVATFAGSRARSTTPRGRVCVQRPAEDLNPGTVRSMVGQFRGLPCDPVHLQGECLDQDLNLDLDLRRVLCDPLHHRDVQDPDQESNLDQGLRSALCDPLHHRDKHFRADDWICTSIMRSGTTRSAVGPPPFSVEPRRLLSSRSARSRTPLGGFGDRFLSQEDTPVSAPGLVARGLLA